MSGGGIQKEREMKHMVIPVAIGTCLLLSSAGLVFADNPHTTTNPTGQPGTGGAGASCQSLGTTPGNTATNPNSPFGNPNKVYAGAGAGNSNNASPNANSQYDVACFQQSVHQMP
jgi:hypothetical protein